MKQAGAPRTEVHHSVVLRPVRPEDQPFLMRVYVNTRTEELAVVPWSPAEKELFLRQQFDAQHRHYQSAYPDGQFNVICAGPEDIGRLYVWRGRDELRIVDIALLPEWRGQGIGTLLIRTLLDEATATHRSVSIHVEQNNPALRLYERFGFQRIQETGVYWLMQWNARQ